MSIAKYRVLTPIKLQRTRHAAHSEIDLDTAAADALVRDGYVVAMQTTSARAKDDQIATDSEAKPPITSAETRDRVGGAKAAAPADTPAAPAKKAPRTKAKA